MEQIGKISDILDKSAMFPKKGTTTPNFIFLASVLKKKWMLAWFEKIKFLCIIAKIRPFLSIFLKFLNSYQQNHLILLKLSWLYVWASFWASKPKTEKYGPKRQNFDQIPSTYFYREVVRRTIFQIHNFLTRRDISIPWKAAVQQ